MKKLLSLIVVLLAAFGMGLVAQTKEATAIAGKWTLAVETPHGPMGGSLTVKQDGSKISGTCDVEHLGSMPLTGSLDGNKISFSIEVQEGQKFTFAGTIQDNKMSGTTDPAGGSWSATKQ